METREAEILVEGLNQRFPLGERDRGYFLNILKSYEDGCSLQENSFHYAEKPNILTHILSLHRIIDNGLDTRDLSRIEATKISLRRRFGIYSSEDMVNEILSHDGLMSLMDESNSDYSMLVRLKTSDFDNDQEEEVVQISPLLIIPEVKDGVIRDWEKARSRIYRPYSFKSVLSTLLLPQGDFSA